MIALPRRKFLIAAAGLIAAPAIVRVGSIMPVKVPFVGGVEHHVLAEAEFRAIHRTDNPAVIFLDILNDADKSIGGRIDWKLIGTAADYCGEMVTA